MEKMKLSKKSEAAFDDFILNRPCGYIDHFNNYDKNYSSIYTPSNNGEFCLNKYSKPKLKWRGIPDNDWGDWGDMDYGIKMIDDKPYLAIRDETKERLKSCTDEYLLHIAQLVVDELEVRGYGSKKN